MQTRSDKEKIVREATDRVRESKALVFAKYEGLTVKETQELKRELRKSGNAFQVLKKTLLSIALREAGVSVDARKLDGQVGLAFSSDETSAAKTMVEFSGAMFGWIVASAIIGTAARFLIQTYAQSLSHHTHGVVILVVEPVWVALLAAAWYGESMSGQQLVGCSLILLSLLVSRAKALKALLRLEG